MKNIDLKEINDRLNNSAYTNYDYVNLIANSIDYMKKIFTLLVILFAISPMFSESLEEIVEKVKSFDSEKNFIFYSDSSFEFTSEKDLFSKKDLFYGKDIVLFIPENSDSKIEIKTIVDELIPSFLKNTPYYISYFGDKYYLDRVTNSDRIIVSLKYFPSGYRIQQVFGLITISGIEKVVLAQIRRNVALGFGEITDIEVAQEREYNESLGKGRFTNKELEVQIANNKNAGLGAFCDAELEAQRKSNEAAGKGYKTDSEIKIEEERLEHEKFLKTIFPEENKFKNKICYLLGYYYDKTSVNDYKIFSTATEKYNELSNLIKNGQPGYGTYNDFQLHDAWKELLIDAEKYGTEYGRFKFTIGKLEQEKLDYSTRTATYSATIEFEESTRYKNVIKLIEEGYKKAYKDDWSDLPQPINWPDNDSVSGHQAASNLIDGVAVYRSSLKENFTDDEMLFLAASASYGNDISAAKNTGVYNAFAHTRAGGKKFKYNLSSTGWFETLLYDLKLNIVDDNGNELVKPNRYLPINAFGNSSDKIEWKNKIEFEGIPQSVMEKIDSGNAHINLVAIYLEYGQYSESDDTVTGSNLKSTRNFMKNFPEIKLSLDKIEYVIQK